MALTKYQSPQIYTPAWNEQIFLYLSDQIAQPEFKYIVEITINAVVYAYDIFARPDGYMVFDAKEVVQNYVKAYFNRDINNYIATTDSIDVQFDVTEYYSSATHATDSESYTAFNACLKNKDFKNYLSTEWYKPTLGDYTDAKVFMNEEYGNTNIDEFVTLTTDYWLTFIRGLATTITWEIFDENVSSLASGTITLPAGSDTDVMRINLSPSYIGGLGSITMQNGYTIEAALNTASGDVADIFIPTINEVCTKYKVYRLYYLKRNDAIGYKTFDKLSEQKINKKINEVRLDPSDVFATGGGFNYGRRDDQHFSNTVSTLNEYSYTLNTDWITEAQSILLDELFDSPMVWLQDDTDGSIQTVSIKDTSYTYKQHANEKLFNYSVVVDVDLTEKRQRSI